MEENGGDQESKATNPSPPMFLEVTCKSSGRVRRFATGTEAGYALTLINRKLGVGIPAALHIEAINDGEEPISFGPNAILVNYGEDWKLQTVTEEGYEEAKQMQRISKPIPSIMAMVEGRMGASTARAPSPIYLSPKDVEEEKRAHPTSSSSSSRGETRSSRRGKKQKGPEKEDSFDAAVDNTRVAVVDLLLALKKSRRLRSHSKREQAAQEIASLRAEVKEWRSVALAAQFEKAGLTKQIADLIMQRDDGLGKLTERCAEVESLRAEMESLKAEAVSRTGAHAATLREMEAEHMKLLMEIKHLRDQTLVLCKTAKDAVAFAEAKVLEASRKGSETASRVSGRGHSGGH